MVRHCLEKNPQERFHSAHDLAFDHGELLQRKLEAEHPGQRLLEQIRKAAERAAGLTRQLLAFSRKQVLDPKVLDLNEVLAGVEKMLRRLIGENVEIQTRFAEGIGRVKADAGQIEQVIINLAVNARDAMPEGGRLALETANATLDAAYARTHSDVHAGPYVMLAVSDTGHGMSAETLGHIFEPFFTTKEEARERGSGSPPSSGSSGRAAGTSTSTASPGEARPSGSTCRASREAPRQGTKRRLPPCRRPPAPRPSCWSKTRRRCAS